MHAVRIVFLSKPQAWHIITAQSVVHIISPYGAVSHHASACILSDVNIIRFFDKIQKNLYKNEKYLSVRYCK